jgi:putative transposase
VLETELWKRLRHRRCGESRRKPLSLFLWPPRQPPTLQRRNVLDHLTDEQRPAAARKLNAAYALENYAAAKQALNALHRELMDLNPSAARSLGEGMEETLTLHRLHVPMQLRKTLASTNVIESAFSIVERVCRNVKRWHAGDQRERWVGSGLLVAQKQFRRITGYKHIPVLIRELEAQAPMKVVKPRKAS